MGKRDILVFVAVHAPDCYDGHYAKLLGYLTSVEGESGDAANGANVFQKAQCAKCHRFGGRGEGVGPDLSMISQRFQRKEILESILFPSQVISDQYMSKTVVTNSGQTYTGLLNSLSLAEIADLFAYLNKATESHVTVRPSVKRRQR